MGTAALHDVDNQPHAGLNPMNISLIVNIKGNLCLVHDEPFDHIPLWVRYQNLTKRLEILFDNGTSRELPNAIPETLNAYLVKASRISLIRTENKNPVEAWDTILLNDSYH